MPPTRIPLPSLTGGVSTQPPSQRRSDQVEDATNVLMHLFNGAERRPGTEFIKSPDTTNGNLDYSGTYNKDKLKIHWINRDANNRYVILIDDDQTGNSDADAIQIFDVADGDKITVDTGSGSFSDFITYLRVAPSVVAKDKIKCLTVADTTLITNQEQVVGRSGSLTSYTAHSGFGYSDDKSYGDINPASDLTLNDYYFFALSSPGYPAGWYQCISTTTRPYFQRVPPDDTTNYNLDPATMPHKLSLDPSVPDFVADEITWTARLSGDDDTNPAPLIVGKKITAVNYHRDRLFFGAGEAVTSSQTGDFFNLWADVEGEINDADRIEFTLSSEDINNIRQFAGFSNALVILTDNNQQFELRAESFLAPDTFNVIETTAYGTKNIPAVTLGNQLYFFSDTGNGTAVWEYFYDDQFASNIAVEVTSHSRDYIVSDLKEVKVSRNNDMLFLVPNNSDQLYIIQSFWNGTEKIQNAVHKWDLNGDIILSVNVYDNYLYMVIERDNKLWLQKASIVTPANDSGLDYNVRLDRKTTITGVYNADGDGKTKWTLPYLDTTIDTIVLAGGHDKEGLSLSPVNTTVSGVTVLSTDGNFAGAGICGRMFESSIVLSEQFVRDENGGARQGHLQLKRLTIRHKNTGYYEVHITPTGRETEVRIFTNLRIGSSTATIGNTDLIDESGEFPCTIMANSRGSIIKIVSDSVLPFIISNAEFIGTFVPTKAKIT